MTTVRTLDRQAPPSDKELAFLDPTEIAIFGARVHYVTVARTEAALSMAAHWSGALILLTGRRLLVERQAFLGKVKIGYEAAWSDVSTVTWTAPNRLVVEARNEVVEVMAQPDDVVEIEGEIRARYLNYRERSELRS